MNELLRTQGHWYQALTLHHAAPQRGTPHQRPARPGRRPQQPGYRAAPDRRLSGGHRQPCRRWSCIASSGVCLGEANALNDLGIVQQATGDYPAATASQDQALKLYRDLHNRPGEANALNDLGTVQQATENAAATASHARALKLHGDLGNPLGQAYALNYLGTVQQATSRRLCGRQHQPRLCAEAVPRPRQPARRSQRPQRPRCRAAGDRGLSGRQHPAPRLCAEAVPRPRRRASEKRRPSTSSVSCSA